MRDGVAEDVVERVVARDVTAGAADDHRELDLPVDLFGDRAIELDLGVGADDGRRRLAEEDRLLRRRRLLGRRRALADVLHVVQAERDEILARLERREQLDLAQRPRRRVRDRAKRFRLVGRFEELAHARRSALDLARVRHALAANDAPRGLAVGAIGRDTHVEATPRRECDACAHDRSHASARSSALPAGRRARWRSDRRCARRYAPGPRSRPRSVPRAGRTR